MFPLIPFSYLPPLLSPSLPYPSLSETLTEVKVPSDTFSKKAFWMDF